MQDCTVVDASFADGSGGRADSGFVPIVVTNGDFENGCTGWRGDFNSGLAELTPSNIAHGGLASCQVCLQAGSTFATIRADPDPVLSPRAEEEYGATAWVRALPSTTSSPRARLYLGYRTASHQGANSGSGTLIDQTWQQIGASYRVPSDALGVILYASLGTANEPVASGECFLIDDVALVGNR